MTWFQILLLCVLLPPTSLSVVVLAAYVGHQLLKLRRLASHYMGVHVFGLKLTRDYTDTQLRVKYAELQKSYNELESKFHEFGWKINEQGSSLHQIKQELAAVQITRYKTDEIALAMTHRIDDFYVRKYNGVDDRAKLIRDFIRANLAIITTGLSTNSNLARYNAETKKLEYPG